MVFHLATVVGSFVLPHETPAPHRHCSTSCCAGISETLDFGGNSLYVVICVDNLFK